MKNNKEQLKKEACLTWNCKPARDLLEAVLGNRKGGKLYLKTLEILKDFEKRKGIGIHINKKAACALSTYYAGHAIGYGLIQRECCDLFDISITTFRKYKKLYEE